MRKNCLNCKKNNVNKIATQIIKIMFNKKRKNIYKCDDCGYRWKEIE